MTGAAHHTGGRAASLYHQHFVRGSLVNGLGLAARLVEPLYILLITWLFGPLVMGLYFLATFVGDVVIAAVTSGFADATTIYGSRHAGLGRDGDASEPLYRVLATGFQCALAGGLMLLVAMHLGAEPLVSVLYPGRPEVAAALRLLAWSFVPLSFTQIALAATKARMRMEYDALVTGAARPLLLVGVSVAAWAAGWGLTGLIAAHVVAQLGGAAFAGWALSRHFDLARLVRAVLQQRPDGQILRFAIPQNLNMTFNRYITRVDLLMLAAFGHTALELAFYGTASLITSNLRQVRLVFSTALAPVAARHHHHDEREALEAVLGQASRWATTIIMPIVLVLAVLRADLLRFVHSAYVGDTSFMVVLLIPPLVNCTLGLAGNCIIYTGHSGWTLANSLAIAVLNTVLNWALIPRYGLLGAAVATALAATAIAVVQVGELRVLERLRLRWRDLYKPLVGMAVGAVVLAVLWDPATLPGFGARATLAGALLALFLWLMKTLGHEEIGRLVVWRWPWRRRTA